MPLTSAISESDRPAPFASLPLHVRLLADDLTGACDAGAAFLSAGMQVRVWTGDRALFDDQTPVQAIVTASRELDAEAAAKAVSRAATGLRRDNRTLVFKKVDSTLRGPLAAELIAARDALNARAILLAPAFPTMGRTVRGGSLEVHSAGRLPIRDLFPSALQHRIALVSHAEELAPALDSGKTILICDSANQDDLDMLARAGWPLPGLLYAGSAGLARAVAGLYPSDMIPAELPTAVRTLLVCGTEHPVTELQLGHVYHARLPGVTVLRIRCESGDEERVREAFISAGPQALVLTGGETALLTLRALGVHSLVLRGEFAPGIPWAAAQGGAAQGRTIVTKSGGFGAASTLNQILRALAGTA